jgi:hypothetical protein
MRHPSEYYTVPLGAMHIMVVDAGTIITDERSGEKATIDDKTSAVKGRLLYCTERVFEAMKAQMEPHP